MAEVTHKEPRCIRTPFVLSLQVILSHGNAHLTFPLPSGIQQSAVVKAVDEDGNICFQVIVFKSTLSWIRNSQVVVVSIV